MRRPDVPPSALAAVTAVIRSLLAIAWITVPPWMVWTAVVYGSTFFGEQPDRSDLLHGVRNLAVGGGVAIAAPLVGLALAWLAADRGAVLRWSAASVIGLAAGVILFAWRADYRPHSAEPRPVPTRIACQEYSGPPARCPGG